MRRIAMTASAALILTAGASSAAKAKTFDDACNQASPSAMACIGADKLNEAAAAECRTAGAPDDACTQTPAGHDVRQSDLDAYAKSWTHRAAQFQFQLGDSVPLRDAQWLGTHNSFNTDANGLTLSHTDNNQQLTLTQQLDGDVRALELDVHYIPTTDGGASHVVVCHGRGPDQYHAGCTDEPLFKDVLPEIATWLDHHSDQVILLYLEDELGANAGYAETVSTLNTVLGSRIYKPTAVPSNGCQNVPLDVSRDDVRAAGANVVLVGNCRAGWASDVFGWDANHVESGSTPGYKPFPACDATHNSSVYDAKLVRYFEDSTWLSAATSPDETPAQHEAGSLTPAKVRSMTDCGVNLFGLDQFEPGDGRVDASIWSWAPNQPDASAGACAVQGADGRWTSGSCDVARPAACRAADGSWTLSAPATLADAPAACTAADGTFSLPRTGLDNSRLHQAAGSAPEVLLNL
jgi:hypothetical protein